MYILRSPYTISSHYHYPTTLPSKPVRYATLDPTHGHEFPSLLALLIIATTKIAWRLRLLLLLLLWLFRSTLR